MSKMNICLCPRLHCNIMHIYKSFKQTNCTLRGRIKGIPHTVFFTQKIIICITVLDEPYRTALYLIGQIQNKMCLIGQT